MVTASLTPCSSMETSSAPAWQARLVHYILPAFFSLLAMTGCLYRVYSFAANDRDYGLFTNLLWNFAHGNGWRVSQYVDEVRVNFLADHMAMLVPLLAPIFRVFPSVYTLSVLHGLAFTAVFFLAPFLVREVWRDAGRRDYILPALFLLLSLFVFKGFTAAWRFQAHMTTLVMPFILCSLIALHRKSLIWAFVFAVLVGMAQERAAVAVVGIGLYAFFITGNRRFGAFLCLLSTAYFFTVVKVIIPSFYAGTGEYIYNQNIKPLYDLEEKLLYVLNLVLYWFLLPLAGKRALFAACATVPTIAMAVVSDRPTMFRFGMQYQDMVSILLYAAAAHGLLWLTAQRWFARIPRYAVLGAAAACIAFSFNFSRHGSPLKIVAEMKFPPAIAQLNADVARYEHAIPEDIAVYASFGIGPNFSLRKNRYELYKMEYLAQPLQASMVFVAPHASMYPHKSAEPVLKVLDANPSLRLIKDTGQLRVYASRDLSPEKLP